jgi:arylformamidase
VNTRTLLSPEQFIAWSAAETKQVRQRVPCVLDIAYGPAPLQRLDVYRQAGARGQPVLVDVHGGGWQRGTKNGRGFPAETLMPRGVVWVPIDYRLAPDAPLPEIVDDVRRAVAWVHANIAGHGGDPKRIYITGHSAGGQLAAMALLDGWHAALDLPTNVIKGACLVSGVFDIRPMAVGFGLSADEAARYTPFLHPPKASGPVVLAYGGVEHPHIAQELRAFAQAWRTAGLGVSTIECPGDDHFSIARTLADPAATLNRALMEMMGL